MSLALVPPSATIPPKNNFHQNVRSIGLLLCSGGGGLAAIRGHGVRQSVPEERRRENRCGFEGPGIASDSPPIVPDFPLFYAAKKRAHLPRSANRFHPTFFHVPPRQGGNQIISLYRENLNFPTLVRYTSVYVCECIYIYIYKGCSAGAEEEEKRKDTRWHFHRAIVVCTRALLPATSPVIQSFHSFQRREKITPLPVSRIYDR